MTYGATNPERFPRELISAMPPAAAAPVRNCEGRGQKVGSAEQVPTAQTVTAAIVQNGLLW